MEKITVEQFKKWVVKEGVRLEIFSSLTTATISKNLQYDMYEVEGKLTAKVSVLGYCVTLNGVKRDFSSLQNMVKFLLEEGFINNGEILISKINGEYTSFEQFNRAVAFENATMGEIIEKSIELGAKSFVLVSPLQKAITKDYPFGVQKIDEEMAKEIFEESLQGVIERSKALYKNKIKQGEVLPEFNFIMQEIYSLWFQCFSADSTEGLNLFREACKKVENNLDIIDFYNEFLILGEQKVCLDKTVENKFELAFDLEFDQPQNALLGDYLSDIEVTFSWHTTTTTRLYKVFKFELNEQTKGWLMQFENDYKIEGFEDLAFYAGDELIFSSCTHEKFHWIKKI